LGPPELSGEDPETYGNGPIRQRRPLLGGGPNDAQCPGGQIGRPVGPIVTDRLEASTYRGR
jgi:hypothetical protein